MDEETIIRDFEEERPMTEHGLELQLRKMLKKSIEENTKLRKELSEQALKQESILDKISSEIMQLYNEVEVVDYDHNDVSRIKKAHWIIREEVLWIIDKYNSHPKRGADMREGD